MKTLNRPPGTPAAAGKLPTPQVRPGVKSEMPAVKLFAKVSQRRNGTYSPNGTRWILSYVNSRCPEGLSKMALFDASHWRFGPSFQSTTPTRKSLPASLAILSAMAANCESCKLNGAGTSGQMTMPGDFSAASMLNASSWCMSAAWRAIQLEG